MAHLAEAKKTSKTQADISADSKDASLGADPKFLVGVAVSVYQNSGAHCSVTLSMLSKPAEGVCGAHTSVSPAVPCRG